MVHKGTEWEITGQNGLNRIRTSQKWLIIEKNGTKMHRETHNGT